MDKQQVIYQIQQALQMREADANGQMGTGKYTIDDTDRALLAKELVKLLLDAASQLMTTPTPTPAVP